MKKFYLILFSFLINSAVFPQSLLFPSIGINYLPGDNDTICYIPMFPGNFYTSGIQEGDTAADFKFYNLNGDSIVLSSVLNSGKPVLMIAGSYTCPVFRDKINSINNIYNLYGSQVGIMIIYTIEAHPDIDTSVYYGYVHTGSQNINEGILYRQPVTYGERKNIVTDMLNDLNIQAPVYIDGPCNNWWNYYGPAPNNAYLINTDGTVFSKHGWYDKFPDNIMCDIDSLLNNPVTCPPVSANGYFIFNLLSADTVYGSPGSTITFSGEVVNITPQDAIIDVYRLVNNLPAGWASSLCLDVCYATNIDSATIYLPAMSTMPFYFYIYTDGTIDTAKARVGFRNAIHPNNDDSQDFVGFTQLTTGQQIIPANYRISIYPNPSCKDEKPHLKINLNSGSAVTMRLYDLTGRFLYENRYDAGFSGTHEFELFSKQMDAGAFVMHVSVDDAFIYTAKLVVFQ